jgi:replication factor A1
MVGIATLQVNANANIEGTITAVSEVRQVNSMRGPSQVADATLQDSTGTITLTLWGADATKYKSGQKIKVIDGWVKDYKGKLQVSLGRSGRIEVVA